MGFRLSIFYYSIETVLLNFNGIIINHLGQSFCLQKVGYGLEKKKENGKALINSELSVCIH